MSARLARVATGIVLRKIGTLLYICIKHNGADCGLTVSRRDAGMRIAHVSQEFS